MASERKLVRSKSGLRMIPTNGNTTSPFELPEPPWISDKECLRCVKCQTRFDFMKRRHHCRRCGQIFCNNCCDTHIPLPRMSFVDPVRLCALCSEVTQKENEFYEKHLKTLTNGANFTIINMVNKAESEGFSFFCKLSSDQRFIIFDGGNLAKHEPLELNSIESAEILKSDDVNQGNVAANGWQISYLNNQNKREDIRFIAAVVPNKRQSVLWIASMHKAMKMVFEVRNMSKT